LCASVGN